ncbi:MAG: hypothetical protein MUC55_06045 [Burkholderiales bacterium]|jgi:hypothetical protein|nr:hypothetical protein [Burkholderiales bacterium]
MKEDASGFAMGESIGTDRLAPKDDREFVRLVADDLEHQRSRMPVHEWEVRCST